MYIKKSKKLSYFGDDIVHWELWYSGTKICYSEQYQKIKEAYRDFKANPDLLMGCFKGVPRYGPMHV